MTSNLSRLIARLLPAEKTTALAECIACFWDKPKSAWTERQSLASESRLLWCYKSPKQVDQPLTSFLLTQSLSGT